MKFWPIPNVTTCEFAIGISYKSTISQWSFGFTKPMIDYEKRYNLWIYYWCEIKLTFVGWLFQLYDGSTVVEQIEPVRCIAR